MKDANEKHLEIKKNVEVIQKTAEKEAKNFAQYKQLAEDSLATLDIDDNKFNYHSVALFSSIPVVGTLVSAVVAFIRGAIGGARVVEEMNLPKVCEVPLSFVVGGAAGIVGGAAGALISVAHLPAAPFLWAHYIYKNGSKKAYAALEGQFSDIALQMGLVEEHLGKIENCLENIETKLSQGSRAERKLTGKETDNDKRRKMAKRAIKQRKTWSRLAKCTSIWRKCRRSNKRHRRHLK
jgi:hypothetical protein